MTRHGVAVVKVRILHRIKLDDTITWAASVHLQTDAPILADAFDGSQLAVGQLQVWIRRGELHTVSDGESPLLLAVDGNSLLAPGIVAHFLAALALDGEPVVGHIDADNAG